MMSTGHSQAKWEAGIDIMSWKTEARIYRATTVKPSQKASVAPGTAFRHRRHRGRSTWALSEPGGLGAFLELGDYRNTLGAWRFGSSWAFSESGGLGVLEHSQSLEVWEQVDGSGDTGQKRDQMDLVHLETYSCSAAMPQQAFHLDPVCHTPPSHLPQPLDPSTFDVTNNYY